MIPTKEQIIKSLECCRDNEKYGTCKYCHECYCADCDLKADETHCMDVLFNRAIELIYSLIAENEALSFSVKSLSGLLSTGKAEGIKEFAERLKLKVDIDLCEAIECSDYLYDLPKLIDNLVKEMVGDTE